MKWRTWNGGTEMKEAKSMVMKELKRIIQNKWIEVKKCENDWMKDWNDELTRRNWEKNKLKGMNWHERIEMNELKGMNWNSMNWHEGIESIDFTSMNWNEQTETNELNRMHEMKELKWIIWNEWIETNDLKWVNGHKWWMIERNELPKVLRTYNFLRFFFWEVELSLQSRAHFANNLFQKWSEPISFLRFSMWNWARATVSCTVCRPHQSQPYTVFYSRMRSKGSVSLMGVWGLCSQDVARHPQPSATVRNRSQPFATVRNRSREVAMAVPMVSSAKRSILVVFSVASLRFAWQAWHFLTFQHVSWSVKSGSVSQAQYFCSVFRRCVINLFRGRMWQK